MRAVDAPPRCARRTRSRPTSASTSKSPGLDRSSGHRHTHGMNQRRRLSRRAPRPPRAAPPRSTPDRTVAARANAASSATQMLVHARRAQMLRDGGLVVLDRVGEEERALLDEIAEPLRARPRAARARRRTTRADRRDTSSRHSPAASSHGLHADARARPARAARCAAG